MWLRSGPHLLLLLNFNGSNVVATFFFLVCQVINRQDWLNDCYTAAYFRFRESTVGILQHGYNLGATVCFNFNAFRAKQKIPAHTSCSLVDPAEVVASNKHSFSVSKKQRRPANGKETLRTMQFREPHQTKLIYFLLSICLTWKLIKFLTNVTSTVPSVIIHSNVTTPQFFFTHINDSFQRS